MAEKINPCLLFRKRKKRRNKLESKTLSKKLTLAVTSILSLIVTNWLGFDIDFETIAGVVSIVIAYLLGQSYIDGKKVEKD